MICPACGSHYAAGTSFCPDDGSALLVPGRASDVDPLVGLVVDQRYRIEARIGGGAFGEVYRAELVGVGRSVAIKVLAGRLVADNEMRIRFQREVKAASRLESQHAVRVFDFGELADGRLYYVMELVRGVTLDDRIGAGRIEPVRAVRLLDQLLAAIQEAHRHGIIHRDLKPGNIMIQQVDGAEILKVLDFGIAKLLVDGPPLTETGRQLGSPPYMSPEQAGGAAVDARSDLYSVGVILFEMLSGRRPFNGSTVAAFAYQHLHVPAPSLRGSFPDANVPAPLDLLVASLLEKSPDARPQSAQDVRQLIASGALLESTGDVAGDTHPVLADRGGAAETSRRPLLKRALAAGVLVAVVLGGLFWGYRGLPGTEDPRVDVQSAAEAAAPPPPETTGREVRRDGPGAASEAVPGSEATVTKAVVPRVTTAVVSEPSAGLARIPTAMPETSPRPPAHKAPSGAHRNMKGPTPSPSAVAAAPQSTGGGSPATDPGAASESEKVPGSDQSRAPPDTTVVKTATVETARGPDPAIGIVQLPGEEESPPPATRSAP